MGKGMKLGYRLRILEIMTFALKNANFGYESETSADGKKTFGYSRTNLKPAATLPYYCPVLQMRKLSASIFESFGRGIPLDREMTVGAEKVRKRGVNK